MTGPLPLPPSPCRGAAAPPAPAGTAGGFSLVEVTLSLGIMAFCMIAILGLLPVGLNTQQSAQDEARASTAINLVATATRSVQRDTAAKGKYRFPQFLSDEGYASPLPLTFKVGDEPSTHAYFLLEDGSILKSDDPTVPKPVPRQTLFVQITPPKSAAEPLRIYAAVTWPWRPTDKATTTLLELKGRQGFVDSFIFYALRD